MPTEMVSGAERDARSEEDSPGGDACSHEEEVNKSKEPIPTAMTVGAMVVGAEGDARLEEDSPGKDAPSMDESPSKKSKLSISSMMSMEDALPEPRCGRFEVCPCDEIDVRGVVGYQTPNSNDEDHHSWMAGILHEITQEMRVLFFAVLGGCIQVLPLLPAGWLRHGSISGSSLGEHIPRLMIGGWFFLNFNAFVAPGLFCPELESWWNYAIINLFTLPLCLSLMIVPWVDGFKTDNIVMHILHTSLLNFATPSIMPSFLCSALRVHRVKQWMNPLKFFGNMRLYLPDAIAVFCHFQACILPPFWILFDILYVASGATGDALKQARPAISMCIKRLAYVLWGKSAERLGSSYKIYGVWQVDQQNALMTMVGAIQCRSWRQLLIFMLLDWVAFLSRIWCLSGTLNNNKLFNLLRRFMVWGKPSPPPPLSKAAYRGYEIIVEGKCLTISLLTMIIFYPISKLTFKHDALARFVYPVDDSIYFLFVFGISDVIQDQLAFKYVGWKTKYYFESFFTRGNMQCFIKTVLTNAWTLGMLTLISSLAEVLKVGPFKDD